MLKLPYEPRVLADSINWTTHRLTTVITPIPTVVLAQLRTHRLLKWSQTNEELSDFSVNANSDRAIPIKKKIDLVNNNPYDPVVTLANKGMTAIETVDSETKNKIKSISKKGLDFMVDLAKELEETGASKQYVNRFLMPFSWSDIIITGDDIAWNHFFGLRTKDDADPGIRYVAKAIQDQMNNSTPKFLYVGEWHISFNDLAESLSLTDKLMVSGSCCARISYDIEREETIEKHRERFTNCVTHGHVSVAEHQAKVPSEDEKIRMQVFDELRSNVKGWILLRKLIESKDFIIKDGNLLQKKNWGRYE